MDFGNPPSAEEKSDFGLASVSLIASGGSEYNSSILLSWDVGVSGGVCGGWIEVTIWESTALASSLWLPVDREVKPKSLSSLLQSPAVLEDVLVLGLLFVIAELAGEPVKEMGCIPPDRELVLDTVLESTLDLTCKFDTFVTNSDCNFLSSKDTLSDVPLPDIVLSVDDDWTLSDDPISS